MIKYIWARILKKMRGVAIKESKVSQTAKVGSGSQLINSSLGRYSYCGYDCTILSADIGAFSSIADNVTIGGAQHPYEWISMSPAFYEGKNTGLKHKFASHNRPTDSSIKIGNDVWIGKGAYIKAGLCIGDGAVIGMGAVVTKDVSPYCIVGGNPACLIKKRFDDKTIEKLLEINWWEWEDEKIQKYGCYFNNPNDFFRQLMLDGSN